MPATRTNPLKAVMKMAFKASNLVAFAQKMVGQPYWYGTCVHMCSKAMLTAKTNQYPAHYGESRMPTYRKHIAAKMVSTDCVGLIKGFFWTDGGKGVIEYINGGREFSNKYGSNNCPDVSADGMLDYCKRQKCKYGKISALPEQPGVLLFSPGHVGIYIGGGYAIEARGFAYGVVRTKVSQRGWKTWAYLPDELLTYDGAGAPVEKPVDKSYKLGDRILKRTSPIMTGADVADLQKRLNALGYDCGAADGEYGKATETGVKAFQAASDIEVDGEFGPASLAALKAAEAPKTKSVETVAREVIAGKWGNGAERKKKLEAAGYNYTEVQRKVNDLL